MLERWERLEEFPDYAISNYGDVCNIRRDRLLSQSVNQQGIVSVGLVPPQGRQTMRSVALLVIKTFDDDPRRPDHFNSVIHVDAAKDNCRLDNLMWRPRHFARGYHEQFNWEWFHESEEEIVNLTTKEHFVGYKDPCMTYGIKATGIILSSTNDEYVFPSGHRYRRL